MGKLKYKQEFCAIAERLAFRGETMDQIAEALGCEARTLYRWRDSHDEMCQALRARESADDAVEDSLYKQAIDGNTNATVFWLKNRRNKSWKDKQEMEVSGEVQLFGLKKFKPADKE